jgi:hypothetical protein
MSQVVILDTPIEKPQPTIVFTKYAIANVEVILSNKANIRVILYNNDNTWSDDRMYIMEGQEYALWKDDDTYVNEWIHSKLFPPLPVDPSNNVVDPSNNVVDPSNNVVDPSNNVVDPVVPNGSNI